jgi:hypothetical protein
MVAIEMQIREDQILQMARARRDESYRLMLAELRQTAPGATAHFDDAKLLATIRQAAEKAREYGVTSNRATTDFVKIAVFAGISFDQDPTVQRFLKSPELDPNYKVSLLAELVAKRLNEMV